MSIRTWNWQMWCGLVLSGVAFISYPMVFARWPVTRDFPWVNLLIFVIALALLFVGVRRAARKTGPVIATAAGAGVLIFFAIMVFVGFRKLPVANGAPRVGSRAPDFTLLDTNHRPVSLSQLLASSPRGVVLIFYRGYW